MKTVVSALIALALPALAHAQTLTVWDTGSSSPAPLAAEALKKTEGWHRISRGGDRTFKGDAILGNGRVTAVFRKKGSGVELYSETAARAVLLLLDSKGQPGQGLRSLKIINQNRGAVRVEAAFGTATAQFQIKRGDVTLEVAPGTGAGRLRLQCPAPYVILPDLFADDIVVDANVIPLPRIDVPSENFLMHLTGEGDAFAMAVFESPDQEVALTLAGKGAARRITGSEIHFGKKGKIFVAIMEAPGIWHRTEVREEDKGKVKPLGWKMPFPAQWRIDFSTSRNLTDSWEMLLQKEKGGSFQKPSWMGRGFQTLPPDRKRWNTVLGTYKYPCWTDSEGRGFLQPIKHRALAFRGTALIYPINRLGTTPTHVYSVIDIVRNSLGVGPCEYILDLEGQKTKKQGKATCSTRDFLKEIYKNGEQVKKRKQVDERLDQVLQFVTFIRSRIEIYRAFGKEILPYLAERKKNHPELAEPIEELEDLAREIERRVERRRDKIKPPDHVVRMNTDFRKRLLGYTGEDALDKVTAYSKALVTIGDNQDELSAECRWAVKSLRQRAGMIMALDPRMREVATEVRERSRKVLRNPAGHENARH